jgi:5-methylcytosine-specific restriction endonuclease McrA
MDVIINALLAENPDIKGVDIRFDEKTQQASVIDIIKLVTGKSNNESAGVLRRFKLANCTKLKINGKGNKTPVAPALTLIEIILELPGQAAKAFRRTSAHWICRIMGGDMKLAQEIERRHEQATPEQNAFFLQKTEDLDFDRKLKRRQAELDMQKAELEIQERQFSFKQKEDEHRLSIIGRTMVLRQQDELFKSTMGEAKNRLNIKQRGDELRRSIAERTVELKRQQDLSNKGVVRLARKKVDVRSKNDGKTNTRKKAYINRRLKKEVWSIYEGQSFYGECYACDINIDVFDCHYGHVISEHYGGPTNLANLRPICSLCNQASGIRNMKEFAATTGFDYAKIMLESPISNSVLAEKVPIP